MTAASGLAHVAAARAGQPTSMIEVWIPQLVTMALTLGLTWETNQLMMTFTPAKPMPTISADLTRTFILIRKMSPRTMMMIGIMTMGPSELIA